MAIEYKDHEGRPVSLSVLVRREPMWAANNINRLEAENELLRAALPPTLPADLFCDCDVPGSCPKCTPPPGLVALMRRTDSPAPEPAPSLDHDAAHEWAEWRTEGFKGRATTPPPNDQNLGRCYLAARARLAVVENMKRNAMDNLREAEAEIERLNAEAAADDAAEWIHPCKEWCGCLACTNGSYRKAGTDGG